MVKLFFLIVLGVLGWMGYQRYTKDAFILTDSKEENVAKLRTLATKLNSGLPKELDAETTLLRVDVSSQGVTNRLKTTVANAAQVYNGDRQGSAMQAIRKDACSDRAWKMSMARGFTISYSYVDANSAPLGNYVIRNADCTGL